MNINKSNKKNDPIDENIRKLMSVHFEPYNLQLFNMIQQLDDYYLSSIKSSWLDITSKE